MLITFFPRLWHGNCAAFTAENAEKDGNGVKADGDGHPQMTQMAQMGIEGTENPETGKKTANREAFAVQSAIRNGRVLRSTVFPEFPAGE